MAQELQGIAGRIRAYTSSNIYRKLCGALNTFIKPKLLPPELYGIWSLLTIIATYATYLQLGLRNAMFYRIPYHSSRGEEHTCQAIAATVFYGTLLPACCAAAALLGYALLADVSVVFGVGLAVIASGILLQWYYDFSYDYLASNKRFDILTRANVLRATLAMLLNIVLIYLFGIYGLYAAFLLTFAVMVAFFSRQRKLSIGREFSLRRYGQLIKTGLPIMLYNCTNELFGSASGLVVFWLLGKEQLGFFALTTVLFEFLMQIPEDARDVLDPHMMEHLASGREDIEQLFFFTPLLLTSYLMPFLVGAAYYLAPAAIMLLLPKYVPSIPAMKIIALGSLFYALAITCRGLIVAKNRQMGASLLTSLALGVNIGLSILFVKLGYGIQGVACGCFLAFAILFLLLIWRVKVIYAFDTRLLLKKLLPTLPPLVAMFLVIALLRFFPPFAHTPLLHECACLVIYSLVLFALLLLAARRHEPLRALGLHNRFFK